MIILKSNNLEGYIKKLPSELVLIFGSPTCPVCKEIVPLIEEKLGDQVTLLYIDGDKWEEPADQYDIEFYPTILYLIDGVTNKRIDRVNSKNINKLLK